MDQEYLNRVTYALGRLMGIFWSLEWMLWNVLYRLETPPHIEMPRPRPLFAANIGDRFPLNALTSYDPLGQLITAYNTTATTPIDPSFVALRRCFAVGERLSVQPEIPESPFFKPWDDLKPTSFRHHLHFTTVARCAGQADWV